LDIAERGLKHRAMLLLAAAAGAPRPSRYDPKADDPLGKPLGFGSVHVERLPDQQEKGSAVSPMQEREARRARPGG